MSIMLTSTTPWRSPSIALLSLAAALGGAAAARGDVTSSHYYGPDNYGYTVIHMPDFDQKRAGLPNNGNYYCVPTSTMNAIGYVTNHGFPEVMPGPHYWPSPGNYDLVTNNLLVLGLLMGTNPNSGTNAGAGANLAQNWLGNKFTVGFWYRSSFFTPRVDLMAQIAVNGSLVLPCYGYYDQVGSLAGIPILDRDGGHCVTLTKAVGGVFDHSIAVRDPANSNVLTNQSTFMNRWFDVVPQTAFIGSSLVTFDNLRPSGASSNRYLDKFITIRPKAGYAFSSSNLNVVIIFPFPLNDTPTPAYTTFASATGEPIVDFAVGPDESNLYYIAREGTQFSTWCASIVTGEHVRVDLQPLNAPGRLVVGRHRNLYLAGDNWVQMMPLDPDAPAEMAEGDIPGEVGAMTYNDDTDQLVVLDPINGMLFMYGADLQQDPAEYELPVAVADSMAWDPTGDQCYWVLGATPRELHRIAVIPGMPELQVTTFNSDELSAPKSVDVDDQGHLHIADSGHWKEFEVTEDGALQPIANSPFDMQEIGSRAVITRSRTNYDPAVHTEPAWNDLPPTDTDGGIAECPADITGPETLVPDGNVDALDFLLLISQWGWQCPGSCVIPGPGDITGPEPLTPDGTVDSLDYLLLIAEWGSPGNCVNP